MAFFDIEDWMPPLVKDLVQIVARTFYSDEQVVVLDMLTQFRMIRDDKLEDLFHLPRSQVQKILGFLTATERLVSNMEVRESRSRKKKRLEASDASAAAAAPSKDDHPDTSDSEYVDSDEEADVKREANRIKVTVYYINPCFFVDTIRYRIWRIKTALQRQERSNDSKKAFKCTKCTRTFTELEAMQFLFTSHDPAQAMAAMASNRSTAAMPFRCSACRAPLDRLDVGAVVTDIGKTLIEFENVIKNTRIQELLDRLNGVELEGNHPDEHILQGLITMLGQEGQDGVASHTGTVIQPTQVEIKVETDVPASSTGGVKSEFAGAPASGSAAAASVYGSNQADMMSAIAEHMQREAIRAQAMGAAAAATLSTNSSAATAMPTAVPSDASKAFGAASVAATADVVSSVSTSAMKPDYAKPEAAAVAATPTPATTAATAPSTEHAGAPSAAAAMEAGGEEEDPYVMVRGVPKRLSEITEEDEERMTPDEYQEYNKLCGGE